MTTKLMFKCKGLFVLFYKYIPFAIMHIIPFAIMHIVSFVKYFFLYFYQESVISPSENSKLLKIHVNQIFYLKSILKMLFLFAFCQTTLFVDGCPLKFCVILLMRIWITIYQALIGDDD